MEDILSTHKYLMVVNIIWVVMDMLTQSEQNGLLRRRAKDSIRCPQMEPTTLEVQKAQMSLTLVVPILRRKVRCGSLSTRKI